MSKVKITREFDDHISNEAKSEKINRFRAWSRFMKQKKSAKGRAVNRSRKSRESGLRSAFLSNQKGNYATEQLANGERDDLYNLMGLSADKTNVENEQINKMGFFKKSNSYMKSSQNQKMLDMDFVGTVFMKNVKSSIQKSDNNHSGELFMVESDSIELKFANIDAGKSMLRAIFNIEYDAGSNERWVEFISKDGNGYIMGMPDGTFITFDDIEFSEDASSVILTNFNAIREYYGQMISGRQSVQLDEVRLDVSSGGITSKDTKFSGKFSNIKLHGELGKEFEQFIPEQMREFSEISYNFDGGEFSFDGATFSKLFNQGVSAGGYNINTDTRDISFADIQFEKNSDIISFKDMKISGLYDGIVNKGDIEIDAGEIDARLTESGLDTDSKVFKGSLKNIEYKDNIKDVYDEQALAEFLEFNDIEFTFNNGFFDLQTALFSKVLNITATKSANEDGKQEVKFGLNDLSKERDTTDPQAALTTDNRHNNSPSMYIEFGNMPKDMLLEQHKETDGQIRQIEQMAILAQDISKTGISDYLNIKYMGGAMMINDSSTPEEENIDGVSTNSLRTPFKYYIDGFKNDALPAMENITFNDDASSLTKLIVGLEGDMNIVGVSGFSYASNIVALEFSDIVGFRYSPESGGFHMDKVKLNSLHLISAYDVAEAGFDISLTNVGISKDKGLTFKGFDLTVDDKKFSESFDIPKIIANDENGFRFKNVRLQMSKKDAFVPDFAISMNTLAFNVPKANIKFELENITAGHQSGQDSQTGLEIEKFVVTPENLAVIKKIRASKAMMSIGREPNKSLVSTASDRGNNKKTTFSLLIEEPTVIYDPFELFAKGKKAFGSISDNLGEKIGWEVPSLDFFKGIDIPEGIADPFAAIKDVKNEVNKVAQFKFTLFRTFSDLSVGSGSGIKFNSNEVDENEDAQQEGKKPKRGLASAEITLFDLITGEWDRFEDEIKLGISYYHPERVKKLVKENRDGEETINLKAFKNNFKVDEKNRLFPAINIEIPILPALDATIQISLGANMAAEAGLKLSKEDNAWKFNEASIKLLANIGAKILAGITFQAVVASITGGVAGNLWLSLATMLNLKGGGINKDEYGNFKLSRPLTISAEAKGALLGQMALEMQARVLVFEKSYSINMMNEPVEFGEMTIPFSKTYMPDGAVGDFQNHGLTFNKNNSLSFYTEDYSVKDMDNAFANVLSYSDAKENVKFIIADDKSNVFLKLGEESLELEDEFTKLALKLEENAIKLDEQINEYISSHKTENERMDHHIRRAKTSEATKYAYENVITENILKKLNDDGTISNTDILSEQEQLKLDTVKKQIDDLSRLEYKNMLKSIYNVKIKSHISNLSEQISKLNELITQEEKELKELKKDIDAAYKIIDENNKKIDDSRKKIANIEGSKRANSKRNKEKKTEEYHNINVYEGNIEIQKANISEKIKKTNYVFNVQISNKADVRRYEHKIDMLNKIARVKGDKTKGRYKLANDNLLTIDEKMELFKFFDDNGRKSDDELNNQSFEAGSKFQYTKYVIEHLYSKKTYSSISTKLSNQESEKYKELGKSYMRLDKPAPKNVTSIQKKEHFEKRGARLEELSKIYNDERENHYKRLLNNQLEAQEELRLVKLDIEDANRVKNSISDFNNKVRASDKGMHIETEIPLFDDSGYHAGTGGSRYRDLFIKALYRKNGSDYAAKLREKQIPKPENIKSHEQIMHKNDYIKEIAAKTNNTIGELNRLGE